MKKILLTILMLNLISCLAKRDEKVGIIGQDEPIVTETVVDSIKVNAENAKYIKGSVHPNNIFPADTLIGKFALSFKQVNLDNFRSLLANSKTTYFEQDDTSNILKKEDKCFQIKLLTKEIDTLCNFDDGEYHESYSFGGYSKKLNTILMFYENWEESHGFLINLNHNKHILLSSKLQISPEKNRLLTYSNYIDNPIYQNEFFIFELENDLANEIFTFSNEEYGVFNSKWISQDKILIDVRRIDYENYKSSGSYYFEMIIERDK